MYFSYVRPLLEYSDTVWDNCSLASKKLLDAVHIEAARVVSGGTKLCSVDKKIRNLVGNLFRFAGININWLLFLQNFAWTDPNLFFFFF